MAWLGLTPALRHMGVEMWFSGSSVFVMCCAICACMWVTPVCREPVDWPWLRDCRAYKQSLCNIASWAGYFQSFHGRPWTWGCVFVREQVGKTNIPGFRRGRGRWADFKEGFLVVWWDDVVRSDVRWRFKLESKWSDLNISIWKGSWKGSWTENILLDE